MFGSGNDLVRLLWAALLAATIGAGVAHAGAARDEVTFDFPAAIDRAAGVQEQYAVAVPFTADLQSQGTWTVTGTTRSWHYEVQVPGAVSLSFHASHVSLPAGVLLRVTGGAIEYTYDSTVIHAGELWSRIARGDTLSFDLSVDAATAGAVTLRIAGLQAGYRTLGGAGPNHPHYDALRHATPSASGTTTCVENYECHVTAADTGPGNASVALTIGNLYQCSGVLINDVRGDGTPYILTARHCENGNANGGAPQASQSVVVYFDATTPCGQALGSLYSATTYTLSGAYTVVEQQDTWLIQSFNPVNAPDAYFAGWDATGSAFVGGYSAHYGLGTDRQYTGWYGQAYYAVLPGSDLSLSFTSTYWELVNQVGSVAPGASGSGIFDSSNRLVGVLARARLQGTTENSPGVCPVASPPAPAPSTETAAATALSGVYDSTADPASTTGSVTLRSVLDPQNTGTLVVNGTWTPPQLMVSTATAATGDNVQLSWYTRVGTRCTASGGQAGDGWAGALATSGSVTLTGYGGGTTTYILTCYLGNYQASSHIAVNWTLAAPLVYLNSNGAGQNPPIGAMQLYWNATVAPCVASGGSAGDGWSGTLPGRGQKTVTETVVGTYTYVLTCGTGSRTATTQLLIQMTGPSASLSTGEFTLTGIGKPLTLSGTATGDCSASGGTPNDGWTGNSGLSGFYSVQVTETTPGTYTYLLECKLFNYTASASATITVSSSAPPVQLIASSSTPMVSTDVLQLSWLAAMQPCTLTGSGFVNEVINEPGNEGRYYETQSVIGPYVYTVTCGSGTNTVSASTTVNWSGTPRVDLHPGNYSPILLGTPAGFYWTTNVEPCTSNGGTPGDGWSFSNASTSTFQTITETAPGTYTYGITCGSAGQTATNSADVTYNAGAAFATLTASAPSATSGGPPVVLTWNSNTAPCVRSGTDNSWGSGQPVTNAGSVDVTEAYPGTYNYNIECGVGAAVSASAHVTVTFTGAAPPGLRASITDPFAGQAFTLTWASTDGSPCTGSGGTTSDGWAGAHAASGTMPIVEAGLTVVTYTLQCGAAVPSVVTMYIQENYPPESLATYAGGQLNLPSLVVGDDILTDVRLPISAIVSGPQSAPNYAAASYDPMAGQVAVPEVLVGGAPYYSVVATVGSPVSIGGATGADSYDGSQLTIPSVQVAGGRLYNNVVVRIAGVIHIGGGMPRTLRDQYDPASGQLQIPVVVYAGKVYTNVTAAVGTVVSIGS